MAIERVGPGGIPNAYGARLTRTPTSMFIPKPKDVYTGFNPEPVTGLAITVTNESGVLTATLPWGMSATGGQWYKDTGSGPVAISGATALTYTLQAGDVAPFGSQASYKFTYVASGISLASVQHGGGISSYGAASPVQGGTVALTQAQSPYTLSAADNGKTLTPSATSDFVIIHPDGLPSTFTVNIAPTGLAYPTEVRKANGAVVSVKNSGWEIDNANNMANRFVLPGGTITIAPSGPGYVITGNAKRWQVIASRTGYSDSSTGGNLQITGVTLHECKMPAGYLIPCVRAGFINAVGLTEAAPTGPASFAWAAAYPVGATPQRALFSGVDTGTITGKGTIETDTLLLTTPITPNTFLESRAWTGVTSGDSAQSGKGSIRSAGVTDINKKEFFGATTTAGTAQQSILSAARTSLADTAIATSSSSSNSIFRPAYILGLTDIGATAILVDSRAEPSNGDVPTIGGSGYAGEGERVWGRQSFPMLNLACASAGVTTLMQGTGTERRKALKYCARAKLNGVQNDLNKGTVAAIRAEFAKLKIDPFFAGKPLIGQTTSPFTTSSDQWTTIAGQAAGNVANCQLIEDYNNALVAGSIPEFDGFLDLRGIFSTNVNSGLTAWNVAPGARTVTDGVMTAGSNIFTSATAAFTPADTGYKISITGWGTAGGVGTGVMTYISATQVSITGVRSFTNYNSVTTASAQTCYIRSQDYTTDGTHGSQKAGEALEAANLTLPA